MQMTVKLPVAGAGAQVIVEHSVRTGHCVCVCVWGRWGGLHLLNEPHQRRGVPWATGGFIPARHRGGLHHHWGVQGV